MKKFLIGVSLLVLAVLAGKGSAFATVTNPNHGDNPQVVAYYTAGLHAIPTNPITYLYGTDLVTKRGDSGQIQQWYTDPTGHGIHSVWNIIHNGTCPSNWVLIPHAYPGWGYYLTPNTDYCVMSNTF